MLRRIGSALLRWLVGPILVVSFVGALYQAGATYRDARAFPPPGKLVDVGGHRLHIRCQGTGSPTVVLEAGLGGSSLDWSHVAPELVAVTRVCAYDRAGYGWSEPGPLPRTSEQAVAELHALLERAGESGPYLLVGHSLGGLHVRLFAARHPEATAGLVLVDPTDDAATPAGVHALAAQIARIQAWAARTGLIRVAARIGLAEGIGPQLPPEVRPAYLAVSLPTSSFDAAYAEAKGVTQSARQVRESSPPGDLPVAVIRPGIGEDHYVQLSQPGRVVGSVLQLLNKLRTFGY